MMQLYSYLNQIMVLLVKIYLYDGWKKTRCIVYSSDGQNLCNANARILHNTTINNCAIGSVNR